MFPPIFFFKSAEMEHIKNFFRGVTKADRSRKEKIRRSLHVACVMVGAREAPLRWFEHVQRREFVSGRMPRFELAGRRLRGEAEKEELE